MVIPGNLSFNHRILINLRASHFLYIGWENCACSMYKRNVGFCHHWSSDSLFKPFFGIHQKRLLSPSKSSFGPVVIRLVTKPETKHQTYLWWYQKVEKCLLGVVLGETTDHHQSILPNSGENNIMLSSSTILVHRGMIAKKIVLWESTVFYFNCFKLLTPTVSPKRSL